MRRSFLTAFSRCLLKPVSALSLTLGLVACGGPVDEARLGAETTSQGGQPWDAKEDAPWDVQAQGGQPWDVKEDAPWDVQQGQVSSVIIRGKMASVIIRGLQQHGIHCLTTRVEGMEQPALMCLAEK